MLLTNYDRLKLKYQCPSRMPFSGSRRIDFYVSLSQVSYVIFIGSSQLTAVGVGPNEITTKT